jgi:hypothetical protein
MALVRAALDQLGEPCRELLELRYFGDLSYEELAQALNLHPKTVSSRLSKCLDRLGQIVSRMPDLVPAGTVRLNPAAQSGPRSKGRNGTDSPSNT